MTYTELFKYKHKTYNWIARNNGVMGGDVFQYFNTLTNLYEFTKEEALVNSKNWIQLKYNDKE
jgi:hypothetical protein